MKFISTILTFLVLSCHTQAVSFQESSIKTQVPYKQNKKKPKDRQTASDLQSRSIDTLKNITSCVKTGKSVVEINTCSQHLISKSLNKGEKNILLSWFELPFQLSYPEVCNNQELSLLPDEIIKKSKVILCSEYEHDSHKNHIMFFMTEEDSSIKLLNIKK